MARAPSRVRLHDDSKEQGIGRFFFFNTSCTPCYITVNEHNTTVIM